MNRSPRQFECALRPRVREKLRESPALWAEYRQARRARRTSIAVMILLPPVLAVGVPLVGIFFPIVLVVSIDELAGTTGLLAPISAFAVAVAFAVAGRLLWHLAASDRRWALAYLPVPDAEIARQCWWRVVANAAAWIYMAAFAFGEIAWRNRLPALGWGIALGFCVAQWLAVIVFGTALAAYIPRGLRVVPFLLLFLGLPVLIAHRVPAWRGVFVALLFVATPAAWVCALFGFAYLRQDPLAWLVVPLAAVLTVALAYGRDRFMSTYCATEKPAATSLAAEHSAPSSQPIRPGSSLDAWLGWVFGEPPDEDERPMSPDEAQRRIRTREFLAPRAWSPANRIERIAQRRFTVREAAAVEWMTGDFGYWTFCVRFTLAAVVACGSYNAIGFFRTPALTGMAFMLLASVIGEWWRGFSAVGSAPNRLPFYAALPVDLRDVARGMFKLAMVQWLFVLPIAAIAALIDIQWLGLSPLLLPWALVVTSVLALSLPAWRAALLLCFTTTSLDLRSRYVQWVVGLTCCGFIPCFGPVFILVAIILCVVRWRLVHWIVKPMLSGLAAIAGILCMLVALLFVIKPPARPMAPAPEVWEIGLTAAGAALTLAGSYALWQTCLAIVFANRCDIGSSSEGLSFLRNNVTRERFEALHRHQDARRRLLGRFWWLPRHVPAADRGDQP